MCSVGHGSRGLNAGYAGVRKYSEGCWIRFFANNLKAISSQDRHAKCVV